MNNCELIHGDCLKVMPTLLPRSVQMVFADLPYGLPSTSFAWDCPIELAGLWRCLSALLKERSAICMTASQPFSSHLVTSNVWQFKYSYVWHKNTATNFFNAKTQPLRNHEDILVFASGRTIYNPQMTNGSPYEIQRKATKSLHFNAARRSNNSLKNSGTRYPLTVQKFGIERKASLHPTQKPVALLEWLIRTYTNEGDIVLDPTAGSGTTAIAALRTGRKAICIEKDKQYYEAMCRRVEAEQAQLRMAL